MAQRSFSSVAPDAHGVATKPDPLHFTAQMNQFNAEDYIGVFLGTPWGLLKVVAFRGLVDGEPQLKVVCLNCGWWTNRRPSAVLNHRFHASRPTNWCGPCRHEALNPGEIGKRHPAYRDPDFRNY